MEYFDTVLFILYFFGIFELDYLYGDEDLIANHVNVLFVRRLEFLVGIALNSRFMHTFIG